MKHKIICITSRGVMCKRKTIVFEINWFIEPKEKKKHIKPIQKHSWKNAWQKREHQ